MKRQFFCAAAASWALALGAANAAGPSSNCGPLDSYSYVENAGYSCNERSATSYVQPASYLDDECEQYGGWCERFYTGIKETFKRCSLKKYKRAQRLHRGLMYPECPPYCSPTFGYHMTQWRPFPGDCEYVWSSGQPGTMWQSPPTAPPALIPLSPAPANSAPPAPGIVPPADNPTPYFPNEPPMSSSSNETAPDLPPGEALPPVLRATPAGAEFRAARRDALRREFEGPVLLRIE